MGLNRMPFATCHGTRFSLGSPEAQFRSCLYRNRASDFKRCKIHVGELVSESARHYDSTKLTGGVPSGNCETLRGSAEQSHLRTAIKR
jgi:hypothetical protein